MRNMLLKFRYLLITVMYIVAIFLPPLTLAGLAAGTTQPTGADASTYHYNDTTGKWENDYYIWDPTTGQTQPKTPQSYSYNPTTGMWDTTEWKFDATTQSYVPNTISVQQPPAGAITTNPPETTTKNPTNSPAPSSISPSNPTSTSNTADHTYDLFYNAAISNNLTSTSHTGDVNAISNTRVGNATSGDAAAISTLINLLQSSWSPNSAQLATFTSNIQGDVVGDLLIDPGNLSSQLSASNTPATSNLNVNANANEQINNAVALDAGSGNVSVANNTKAGNATSGSANAVANVVNMLNSAIGAGQSFLGVINIYGNLNGDILLPPDVLNTLLANNTTPTITTSANANGTVDATLNNTQAITNNISATASTGTAAANMNTASGNVTTGNASTNITLLNLTGKQIIGSDALLVFVNVLGKWVGLIVNAPTGSTSAALGGGISQNSNLPPTTNSSTDVNNSTSQSITNNILVNAASGNVLANGNTEVGNVTSGNATASVNLANLINSSLSLSNWFGILFINVFGNWTGSFGIDTAAGGFGGGGATDHVANNVPESQVFQFIPAGSNKFKLAAAGKTGATGSGSETVTQDNDTPNAVLVSSSNNTKPPQITAATKQNSWSLPLLALLFGAALLGTEQAIGWRNRRYVHYNIRFTRLGRTEFVEPFKSI